MANKQKINTHVLWDNFKRDIDWELKKIKSLPLNKRLDVFNRQPYGQIQTILELMGQWLYKAAVAHLWNKENDPLTEKNIGDFNFYVWPGYDTLRMRNRIFINGESIHQRENQKRYFTGIGARPINSIIDQGAFFDFIEGRTDLGFSHKIRHQDLTKAIAWNRNDNLFFKDNPSSFAFDHSLNPLNVGGPVGFSPPSTHYWKVSQRDHKGDFLPVRLADGSEFRFLHVTKGERSLSQSENVIRAVLDKERLVQSGHDLANLLSKRNLQLSFINEHHKGEFYSRFTDWPYRYTKNPEFYYAQLDCYSYWISESIGTGDEDYSILRKNLRNTGLEQLATRLHPFKHYQAQNPDRFNNFEPTTYNHWYTLYLEGYDDDVDLGSMMILSSHDLNGKSGVLHDFWHWIRWVFNELRLIEANTTQELQSFQLNYSILNHNLDFHLKYSNNLLKEYDQSRYDLHSANLMHLSNLLNLSLNYNKLDEYIKDKTDFNEVITVSLSEQVYSALDLIENDIQNNNGRLLKLNKDQLNSISNNSIYNLSNTIVQDDIISTIPEVLSLLLKDIISNAIKNNFQNGTYLHPIEIRIESSDSDCYLIEIMNGTEFPKGLMSIFNENRPLINQNGLGLQIIKQISESTNYDIQVSTGKAFTKFKIILPFLISAS